MAAHNETGKNGEALAADYLVGKGYQILHQNWRYSHYEIDIIASKGKKLHFVEVKTRTTAFYGYPEESVTRKKFKHLQRAADEYLHLHPGHLWIQYDVLSIILSKNKPPEFFLLEDVFL
ncbi:MAG: YraN family protein [Niabella sp.]